MKLLATKDKIWSWILILFPAVLLIFSLIPGSMQVFNQDTMCYQAGSLIKLPHNTALDNLNLPAITAMAYTVILGICYYRSQGLGTLKAIMIFGFACAAITAFGMIVKANEVNMNMIKPWPYALLPISFIVFAILALIRLKKEEKLLYEEE